MKVLSKNGVPVSSDGKLLTYNGGGNNVCLIPIDQTDDGWKVDMTQSELDQVREKLLADDAIVVVKNIDHSGTSDATITHLSNTIRKSNVFGIDRFIITCVTEVSAVSQTPLMFALGELRIHLLDTIETCSVHFYSVQYPE